MKNYIKIGVLSLGMALLMMAPSVYATTPSLGTADSFSILAGTYTNTTSGSVTTVDGDLGYTTPPATAPTVIGTTYVGGATYNQAGIDQGTALTALNNQTCTFTFSSGAIDLATDTTHGTAGVYAPGVYCITGTASIAGGGTITLTGAGSYTFRMTGALTTSANSVVALAGGALANDIWWTPGAATTLGANSTFVGTDIDASGITVSNNATWTGRALAFGGSITTNSDTLNSSASGSGSGAGTGTPTSSGGSGSGSTVAQPQLTDTGIDTSVIILVASVLLGTGIWVYCRRSTAVSAEYSSL